MLWDIFVILLFVVTVGCIASGLVFVKYNKKYQKEWNKEKAMRMRSNPKISRAELCEYFVMFCLRNDCKVDF